MFLDNKGRLFGKISVIDIVVLFVVIGTLSFGGYKLTTLDTSGDKLELQFYTEEVPDYVAESLKIGDSLKDPVNNTVFGKVVDKKIDKSVSYAQNDKGEYVVSSKPGYSSVVITVEGTGTYADGGATIDNNSYFVGRSLELRSSNSVLWCKVYSIEKKEG